LGGLLTSWKPETRRCSWLPALIVGFLVAVALEAGQLALASRTASPTDVYVGTAGALLGGLITRRVCVPATVLSGVRLGEGVSAWPADLPASVETAGRRTSPLPHDSPGEHLKRRIALE